MMYWIALISGMIAAFVISPASSVAAVPDEALLAHYSFDEGTGDTLHDRSGNGNDGVIHGATWEAAQGRSRLRFDGSGDWVDFGNNPKLKSAGDMTIIAWVTLDASPFPDGDTNWCIVDCESFSNEGFLLRVDGATGTLLYRNSRKGASSNVDTLMPLANGVTCQVALIKQGKMATLFLDGVPIQSSPVGDPAIGDIPFKISSEAQSFSGFIDDLKLYARAISAEEMIAQFQADALKRGKDTSLFGKLGITPFMYPEDGNGVVEINCVGIGPLRPGEKIILTLKPDGHPATQTHSITQVPGGLRVDVPIDLRGLQPGNYEMIASLESDDVGRATQVRIPYEHRIARTSSLPSPSTQVVKPLAVEPQPCGVETLVEQDGGIRIVAGKRVLQLSSEFSEPSGTVNRLGGELQQNADAWKIQTSPGRVHAKGRHYTLAREVKTEPHRVVIRDTLTNLSREAVGIIFLNRLSGEGFNTAKLAGRSVGKSSTGKALQTCPTAFLESPGFGAGVVALDDVFVIQSRGGFERSSARSAVTLGANEFALDAGASYTLEWAIYLNASGDYYDFINAIRKDEGRNNVLIDSGFAMLHGTQESRSATLAPDQSYFDIRGSRNAIVYCLSWATDDRGVSIEGIEFKDFPAEMRALKELIRAIARNAPDVKTMFHIAPNLYATNRPDQIYSDSRIIQADGTQAVYPYDYDNGRYFSSERFSENWRWWTYYPTMTNTFGKALLDSVDLMMDDLGAKGAFVDGFLWGYGGEYTYDRWDGHTADIDPATHSIVRKKGSVLLMSQDAMIAYGRKVQGKGGVLIANNAIITRTLGREKFIFDKEVTEGPYVHLAPTPIAIGNPAAVKTEVDVYRDVRAKLLWGNLYMYYGEPKTLTHPSVPQQMYPITVQQIYRGCVRGRERIVTLNGGIYGWADNRDLHQVYLYDARGHLIPHAVVGTTDAESVRSDVNLDADQAAVIKRVPASISSASPVNFHVEHFDSEEIRIAVNGEGAASLVIRGEGGIIKPGAAYRCGDIVTVADDSGGMTFKLALHGLSVVRISRETR